MFQLVKRKVVEPSRWLLWGRDLCDAFLRLACRRAACIALGLSLIIGCGGDTGPKTVSVSGVVKYKGAPLTRGEVAFVPTDPSKGQSASGKIGPDGKYVLTTRTVNDGAVPGDYKVVVFSYEDPPEQAKDRAAPPVGKPAIPTRYFDAKTSMLEATVNNAATVVDLDLTE